MGGEPEAGASGPWKEENRELVELKRLIEWCLCTLVPVMSTYIITGFLSNSLTIAAFAVENSLSLLSHIFNIVSIRSIVRQNVFKYPYGTGKLENFSSFFFGALLGSAALFILYAAAARFVGPPVAVSLWMAALPMVLATLRFVWLVTWLSRLTRKYPDGSPLTHSYYVNFKVSLVSTVALSAGLLAGHFISVGGHRGLAMMIDLAFSIAVSLYMLANGIRLAVKDFKSLVDFPLQESDQLKIIGALTAEFHSYENLGNIRAQLSGSRHVIQIELYFGKGTTLEEIDGVRERLEGRLRVHFKKMTFQLIPLGLETAPVPDG